MRSEKLGENYTVIIPARGGSKGLAGKNVRNLHGKPLFEWAVDLGSEVASRVILATDIEEVIQSKVKTTAEIYVRSDESASDGAPIEVLIQEIILNLGLEDAQLILLQPTSPLREIDDLKKAIKEGDDSEDTSIHSVEQHLKHFNTSPL